MASGAVRVVGGPERLGAGRPQGPRTFRKAGPRGKLLGLRRPSPAGHIQRPDGPPAIHPRPTPWKPSTRPRTTSSGT